MERDQRQIPDPRLAGAAADRSERKWPIRKSVIFATAFLWNTPIVIIFYFAFAGVISDRQTNLLLLAWAAVIPPCAIFIAHIPFLQRLVLVPSVDMHTMRPKLWALAIMWSLILCIGFVLEIFLRG